MVFLKQHLKTGSTIEFKKVKLDRKQLNELKNNDPLTLCISNSGFCAKSKVIAFSYLCA